MTAEQLEDQLAQVEQDLAEVDEQVAAGELNEATASRLRSTYRDEAANLRAQLIEAGEAEAGGATRRAGVSRTAVGVAIFAAAAIAVLGLVVVSLDDRPPGGSLTGGVAADVLGGEQPNLDEISNEEMEAVVAANPDVVAMRLALARRYFDAGEFTAALEHYMTVLESEQHPEALANVGWMTHLSGRPDVAAEYVEEALVRNPSYLPALWFLANIRLDGLGDPAGARPPLERLLAADGVPDDIRAAAEAMLGKMDAP